MSRRGLLIVFEGLDRSGKSTQSRLLSEALKSKNFKTELWQYPNRKTTIGSMINDYLSKKIELEDHAVNLLFSANRWETVKDMKEKLNSGVNLIVDRYAYSGVAYTSAKTGFDFDWCKQCDVGLPKADLVCFMDTKIEDLEKRENFGDERYETSEFQKNVYANFKKLFDLEKQKTEDCLILNAKDTIENLHQNVLNNVLDLINSNRFCIDEFKYLW